jgi:four helix bundle protein
VKDFRKLEIWQKSYQIALDVYQVTKAFPKEEIFGLTSQMRRAAVSIPSNIAEGCGRDGDAELARFLNIAMGSASELECQLQMSRDMEMLPNAQYEVINTKLLEFKRQLNTFLQKLKANR